jgi:hypothetical protein
MAAKCQAAAVQGIGVPLKKTGCKPKFTAGPALEAYRKYSDLGGELYIRHFKYRKGTAKS